MVAIYILAAIGLFLAGCAVGAMCAILCERHDPRR